MEHSPADFSTFVAARWTSFVALAASITRDRAAAEDIAQEALIKVSSRWQRIGEGNHGAYCRRIIYRDSVSYVRKARSRSSRMVHHSDGALPDNESQIVAHLDAMRLLVLLPPQQRAVLCLRYLEDLSEKETAAVMGVSIGTVKRHAHTALARLRTHLTRPDHDRRVP